MPPSGVGLHHVADVIQRLVECGRVLVFQHFIADGIDHLRDVQHRHVGQRGGGGVQGLIAAGGVGGSVRVGSDGKRLTVFCCCVHQRRHEQE